MLPDLREIAQKRKELGLTQRELAEYTGVSRSWIAKVETRPETLMPSYAQAKRVFDWLEGEQKRRTLKMKSITSFTVEDVHNTEIEYCETDERIEEVWKRMENNGFSQLPVREREKIVGSLTERSVNRKRIEMSQRDLRNMKVRDAMETPFPMVSVETPVFAIVDLLQTNQAVLTSDGLRVVGIVTNTDLGKIFKQA